MKGKHAQKNFSAVGAMAPTPLSLKTRGEGGGGGLGGSHTRTGLAPPPLLWWVGGCVPACLLVCVGVGVVEHVVNVKALQVAPLCS